MARKPERETKLEDRCVAFVEARGGQALKLTLAGQRGFPDRSILMPKTYTFPAYVWFAEFKRLKKGIVSAQQTHWRAVLTDLGFRVYVIDDDAGFEAAWREMGGL